MKRIFIAGLLLIFFFIFKSEASAAISFSSIDPAVIQQSTPSITFTFTSNNNDFVLNHSYTFHLINTNFFTGAGKNYQVETQDHNLLKAVITPIRGSWETGRWTYTLSDGDIKIVEGAFTVFKTNDLPALYMKHQNFQAHTKQDIIVLNGQEGRFEYRFWYENDPLHLLASAYYTIDPGGGRNFSTQIDVGNPSSSPKAICMTFNPFFAGGGAAGLMCDFRLFPINITTLNPQNPGDPIESNKTGAPSPAEELTTPAPDNSRLPELCPNNSCPTALGPISTNPTGFVKSVFGILLSLAGGIALLLIMVSGYRIMASQGNPEKVKEAQESLTSAIVGLLFIIFSLTILQVIGVDILKIPGFSR